MNKRTVVSCIILFACCGSESSLAKTVKAKPEVIAAIKTVAIQNDVPMPADMFYQGPAESMAMASAVLAGDGRAPTETSKQPKMQIIETMKAHNIDVPTIVKAEFAKAVQTAGPITVTEASASADGQIDLKVEMYGFGQRQGFSPVLYPVLRIEARLTRNDGTVIWQKDDYITPLNKENSGGHKVEEFVQNSELLRATWTNIAAIVSRSVVKTLYPVAKGKR